MPKGIYKVPTPKNESVKSYAPGSPERAELQAKVKELRKQEIEVPNYIGGKEVFTDKRVAMHPPYDIIRKFSRISVWRCIHRMTLSTLWGIIIKEVRMS